MWPARIPAAVKITRAMFPDTGIDGERIGRGAGDGEGARSVRRSARGFFSGVPTSKMGRWGSQQKRQQTG
jgi:hypothetical protein